MLINRCENLYFATSIDLNNDLSEKNDGDVFEMILRELLTLYSVFYAA